MAIQIDTKKFTEKHQRQLLPTACAACKSDGATAFFAGTDGLKHIAAEFADAGASAVLAGHAEHDVAADELSVDAVKGKWSG